MTKVTVQFTDFMQKSEAYGGSDTHMVGVVGYDLVVDGEPAGHHESLIKQSAGGAYTDPIEVELPGSYSGPMDYAAFRDAVEGYFQYLVGPGGMMIDSAIEGSGALMMTDNQYFIPAVGSFEVEDA